MFCYQCEQTERNGHSVGCSSSQGNCGKTDQTSDLQDLLIYSLKGIAQYNKRARDLGSGDSEASAFILYGMFTTLTNVNFDSNVFLRMIKDASNIRDRVKATYEKVAAEQNVKIETFSGPAVWDIPTDASSLLAQADIATVQLGIDEVGEDIIGLRALLLYVIKGVSAYAYHAYMLGQESEEIYDGIENALDFLTTNPMNVDTLLNKSLELGLLNFNALEKLDLGHISNFGKPEPSKACITHIPGKAILVSGHDMSDLAALLKQTEGKGINVYTHGEMLPAHSYPELKKYDHLIGNYGGAWQDQQNEFATFPGPILMTSNCIIEPTPAYKTRIFTTGPVGWPGTHHLENHDFSILIQAAEAMAGFKTEPTRKEITVGFGKDAILGVADKIVGAVKNGKIKHFFLVGGCDGAKSGRNYYSEFVEQTPKDTIVMTLGCAKYRFNKIDHGEICGIPRLLDMGQCNDSYSAVRVALALADTFECSINELPLSLFVSWFEQKAAAVLMMLLALGVKRICLGPTLPAFITPAVLNTLIEKFDIKTNGEPAADLAQALSG
jgi:hydroxylamine reductase